MRSPVASTVTPTFVHNATGAVTASEMTGSVRAVLRETEGREGAILLAITEFRTDVRMCGLTRAAKIIRWKTVS